MNFYRFFDYRHSLMIKRNLNFLFLIETWRNPSTFCYFLRIDLNWRNYKRFDSIVNKETKGWGIFTDPKFYFHRSCRNFYQVELHFHVQLWLKIFENIDDLLALLHNRSSLFVWNDEVLFTGKTSNSLDHSVASCQSNCNRWSEMLKVSNWRNQQDLHRLLPLFDKTFSEWIPMSKRWRSPKTQKITTIFFSFSRREKQTNEHLLKRQNTKFQKLCQTKCRCQTLYEERDVCVLKEISTRLIVTR